MGRKTRKPVFGLIANTSNEKANHIAREVYDMLRGDIIVESDTASVLGVGGFPLDKLKVDILITIGGDGTVLRALQHSDAKILSINAGVLGFLTEINAEDAAIGIDRVLKGDYFVENRLKLRTDLNRKPCLDCTNEAVLHTSQIAKMMHFRIYIDGNLATNVRSDGIIIATPTGSTSYSLSVGGPIVDPRVLAFVIVPMAPFKLSTRPIVVPAESTIRFEIVEPTRPGILVLDGQDNVEVYHKDLMEFTLSKKQAPFIRFGRDFYKRVDEKLRF